MRRRIFVGLGLAAVGCTTCPQADVMDFAFKSKNACCPPGQAPPVGVVAAVPAPTMAPVTAVPVIAAPAPQPQPEEPKKRGHPWLHPFRRNRDR